METAQHPGDVKHPPAGTQGYFRDKIFTALTLYTLYGFSLF